jgi:hypothetical protein
MWNRDSRRGRGNRRRLTPAVGPEPGGAGRDRCPGGPRCAACPQAAVEALALVLWVGAARPGPGPAAGLEPLGAAVLGRVRDETGCRAAAIRRACLPPGGTPSAAVPESGDLVYETCLRVARRCVYGRPEGRL